MSHPTGSLNIPFDTVRNKIDEVRDFARCGTKQQVLCVVCRRGNDSQVRSKFELKCINVQVVVNNVGFCRSD